MKKSYQKPMVFFEDMSFDSAIANTDQCSAVITTSGCQTDLATDLCIIYKIPGLPDTFFNTDKNICSAYKECYHTSVGVQGLS